MKKTLQKGFTLVELMIVVAIIGILAAIAIPGYMTAMKKAQTNACIRNMRQIEAAVVTYRIDNNDVPANVSDLVPDYLNSLPDCPLGGEYQVVLGGDVLVICPNVGDHEDHRL